MLRAEVAAYVEAHAHEVDEDGRRLVVRNGYAEPREVLTSSGAVGVVTPRVNDKRIDEATGERKRFSSAILPPWCRKSPKITEVLPLLYLHGLSSNDFRPALEQFLGSSAGLSGPTITRPTTAWQDEAKAFNARVVRPATDQHPAPRAALLVVGLHHDQPLHAERGLLAGHDPEPWKVEQQRRSVTHRWPPARSDLDTDQRGRPPPAQPATTRAASPSNAKSLKVTKVAPGVARGGFGTTVLGVDQTTLEAR